MRNTEPLNEYALDMLAHVSLRVQAPTLAQAHAKVLAEINCNSANLGAWPDGSPILAEVSVTTGDEIRCYEVNGECSHPDCDA